MQSRGSARDSSFECKLVNYSAFEQREETTISNGCCRECKKKKKKIRDLCFGKLENVLVTVKD